MNLQLLIISELQKKKKQKLFIRNSYNTIEIFVNVNNFNLNGSYYTII